MNMIKYIYFELKYIKGGKTTKPKMANENILLLKPYTNHNGFWSYINTTKKSRCKIPTYLVVEQHWLDLTKINERTPVSVLGLRNQAIKKIKEKIDNSDT